MEPLSFMSFSSLPPLSPQPELPSYRFSTSPLPSLSPCFDILFSTSSDTSISTSVSSDTLSSDTSSSTESSEQSPTLDQEPMAFISSDGYEQISQPSELSLMKEQISKQSEFSLQSQSSTWIFIHSGKSSSGAPSDISSPDISSFDASSSEQKWSR
jgi:hypothetical protein